MMIGLGIDAVNVQRFREALNRTPNLRSRIFTDAELASLTSRADSAPSLAVRFAAREATMKALGVGLGAFDLHDVSIRNSASGSPELVVTGRAAALAQSRGVKSWLVSLSHTDDTAIAVVASN
ncbi:MAG: holo-ACP synthase [Acidimicrobiia bacterium]|nr:holo-ACP synthase [Acidimicrobiia bacterium]